MMQQETDSSVATLDGQRRKQATIRFVVLRPHLEKGVPLLRAVSKAGTWP